MTRKVFFSFHYERDAWRAGIVRNSGITKNTSGFIDSVDWESIQKRGDEGIKRWIDEQLKDTSVTVVLIGAETNTRRWVLYELNRSWVRGNGILGIYIHSLKDRFGHGDTKGKSTFGSRFKKNPSDGKQFFYERFHTYDWVLNDGYHNFDSWVETAARQAGR